MLKAHSKLNVGCITCINTLSDLWDLYNRHHIVKLLSTFRDSLYRYLLVWQCNNKLGRYGVSRSAERKLHIAHVSITAELIVALVMLCYQYCLIVELNSIIYCCFKQWMKENYGSLLDNSWGCQDGMFNFYTFFGSRLLVKKFSNSNFCSEYF